MTRLTKLMVVVPITAVVAFAATGTASAAIFWPHFHVNTKFLGKGESKEIEGSAKTVLKFKTKEHALECKTLKFAKGANIKGGEPGTSQETIEFEQCSITGNGEKCAVTSVAGAKNGKVVAVMKNELVYIEKPAEEVAKNTMIGVYLTPVTVNGPIATVKFEAEPGGNCTVASTEITGNLAGEALESGELLVGYEEHESEGERIRFITKNLTKVWKGKEGALASEAVEEKIATKMFAEAAELEGTSALKLTSKESWGVFVHL
jgi:hypothetical protein